MQQGAKYAFSKVVETDTLRLKKFRLFWDAFWGVDLTIAPKWVYISLDCRVDTDGNRNGFVGIAPSFDYVRRYLGNRNPGAIVEFRTPSAGWLRDRLVASGCPDEHKTEGGGVQSYGLGLKGIPAYKRCNKAFREQYPSVGAAFNDWMEEGHARIVFVVTNRPADFEPQTGPEANEGGVTPISNSDLLPYVVAAI